jgi:hypothetical protein
MFTARRAQFLLSVLITCYSPSNLAPAFFASPDRLGNYTRGVPVDPAISGAVSPSREVGGSKPRATEILAIGRATIYQILSRMKLKEGKGMA